MTLPIIDLDQITTLPKAMNVIEQLLQTQQQLVERLQNVEEEFNRLKGQPKKPSFVPANNQKQSVSVTGFLKEKTHWHKSGKKGTITIDREEKLAEIDACSCGSTSFTTIRTTKKIMQGIIFQRDNVIYNGRVKQCSHCGKHYRSIIPAHLKNTSFSPELSSFLSFWHYACRVTMPLLLRTMTGIGIQISSGQVSSLLLQSGDKLSAADHTLRTAGIKNSSYLQSDASSARRKDKKTGRIINQYVQIVGNKLLSIFSITKHYNAKTLDRLLTKEGREKPFVSDDGSPNRKCGCMGKQLCLVHEIRHYKKLSPFVPGYQQLQTAVLLQWQNFYHLAKHYGEDAPEEMREKKGQIEKLFASITSQVTGYGLLDKQLGLTRKKKERALFFLDHPEVPIHNNQCEQDIRPFVIIRNISGGTKSYRGDTGLARHLSIIQTAQKQGMNVYQTLHGLLTGQLSPTILTANIC